MKAKLAVFVGPSLSRAEVKRLAPKALVLPPARQGDVWRVLESQPHAIALIDGVFESEPSVWHHELIAALDSQVAVFGASSMGALRAAELHHEGVVGVGEVFEAYLSGELTDDSEVALLHATAEHGFRPLTVPLVNVRASLTAAVKAKVLSPAVARRLLPESAATHYTQRHWPKQLPAQYRVDVKAADARACLKVAVEFVAAKAPVPRRPPANPSSLVRRARLQAVHGAQLQKHARRADLAELGTRRLLLAAWGRSMGLQPEPAQISRYERALKARVNDAGERRRLAEALATEALMLEHPERLLNDGPSRIEGLYAAMVTAGL